MQNDVYDYTSTGSAVQKNTVLQKTYRLLGLSFIPAMAGAFVSSKTGFSIYSLLGSGWMATIAFFAFFYAMVFMIEKNRYSNTGVTLLMVLTFGMGVLISPLLQYVLGMSNGAQIVGIAAAMTAAVFFTMSATARRSNINMSSLGRFLTVGAVILMIAVVANLFMQVPSLSLTISAGFVLFSSLLIMFKVRQVIDGGEDSHISAALTIFISLYNIFSSLLHLLSALGSDD
ncbi:Bax inhibitor-1 family protein [Neisseria yangbaofengii]|uniref:Bax inhibitor-1 family protein n=1 Tax=Neisseria yangbaofengii TaxID=2709396 RepID=UPI0013EDD6F6|nr:Bax inhibitor-1 family protein [Neisseria yangbaofengii]